MDCAQVKYGNMIEGLTTGLLMNEASGSTASLASSQPTESIRRREYSG